VLFSTSSSQKEFKVGKKQVECASAVILIQEKGKHLNDFYNSTAFKSSNKQKRIPSRVGFNGCLLAGFDRKVGIRQASLKALLIFHFSLKKNFPMNTLKYLLA